MNIHDFGMRWNAQEEANLNQFHGSQLVAVATSIQCQQKIYTLRNLCWTVVNFLSATMGA